ncbi:MAG TPA: tRNA pseudouridine(55) synthase TruB [Gammaproteobacteria bacterium]|nr:tRNA pseudouridine(55) synthase TruB [Gammaproteobacteria bacterium]
MTTAKPKVRRAVHGILLLDKPRGISSNAALQAVKRLYGAEKGGHTGNLDPLATGMLPICLGEATKISAFLLDADKHYRTRCLLGVETDSGDSEGKPTQTRPVPEVLNREVIEAALASFRGEIDQIPPMYSALKYQGQPLYKLARQGQEIERSPRRVNIRRLELMALESPCLELEVECSKGTYIRSLVEDIGRKLGCGAHVMELRRLASMPFGGMPMYSLSRLEAIVAEGGWEALDPLLLKADSALPHLPELVLSPALAALLRQGQAVRSDTPPTSGLLRLYAGEGREFMGVGRVLEDGRIGPKRLIFGQK